MLELLRKIILKMDEIDERSPNSYPVSITLCSDWSGYFNRLTTRDIHSENEKTYFNNLEEAWEIIED